jgi:hypothetical protein
MCASGAIYRRMRPPGSGITERRERMRDRSRNAARAQKPEDFYGWERRERFPRQLFYTQQ